VRPARTIAGEDLPDGFHDEPIVAPTGRSAVAELFVLREVPRLALRSPQLVAGPRGRGQPVLVLPGHSSSDLATATLRGYLRRRGFDARGWGLGTNHGDVNRLLPGVLDVVREMHDETSARVHLLGWSLGGVIAREVARDMPELVAQVITYGTPVVGGPRYTLAAASYGPAQVAAIAEQVADRNRRPVPVPLTAFFSRRDRVVAWRACIDRNNRHAEHVEVGSTHVGLGIDPDVWLGVALRLARPRPRPTEARP
jgi:pimeloyl-ACP methyl ester carboxylesterase